MWVLRQWHASSVGGESSLWSSEPRRQWSGCSMPHLAAAFEDAAMMHVHKRIPALDAPY